MKKILLVLAASLLATYAMASDWVPGVEVLTGHEQYENRIFADARMGDDIEPIVVRYTNVRHHEEYGFEDIGLTVQWNRDTCTIFGKLKKNLDNRRKEAVILLQGPSVTDTVTSIITLFLTPAGEPYARLVSDNMDQRMVVGREIEPIYIEYGNVAQVMHHTVPYGLNVDDNRDKGLITISGTLHASNWPHTRNYGIRMLTWEYDTLDVSGRAFIFANNDSTDLRIAKNDSQHVVVGDTLDMVEFFFNNMVGEPEILSPIIERYYLHVDRERGSMSLLVLTKPDLDYGAYEIKVIARGENNNDTARVTVFMRGPLVPTEISMTSDNGDQHLTAGESIKTMYFNTKNAERVIVDGFPGTANVKIQDGVVTFNGTVDRSANGRYAVRVIADGPDIDDTVTVFVTADPLPMIFEHVSGPERQMVMPGGTVEPLVFRYDNIAWNIIESDGLGLDVSIDTVNNLLTLYGNANLDIPYGEYTYTINVVGYDSTRASFVAKYDLVESLPSSSSVESSSSVASSSSVEESSSSIVASSSSIVPSSSSVVPPSSSSEKSSSSSAKSSSSEKSSSSSAKSSSSSAKSSSSKAKSSSSEKGDAIVAAALPNFGLGYVNNELTVTLPKASMVRVQVFDLMGHRVESFSESVSATRSFSLAHLNKGSYVVRVESGRMARSAKIVVK
ncbi:MAG: T9SS type A sorting domain-containing protein [Fibrobacter sp.]|uniref:T9SS type A sorting domain-containing protein n=1 Tax=Fibrobacter sp. TaxID=35828 RepID=UPI0025BE6331|nr:T9SS type A sorting domain-containing protein [Fibrobacter sp.]MBR4786109.1 T9SS type A sorting domain-containing protein [Fibrobacter sp.]